MKEVYIACMVACSFVYRVCHCIDKQKFKSGGKTGKVQISIEKDRPDSS